jgi:hypothetical protein
MTTPTFYFRKAFLSVASSREIQATNVQITAENRAGVKQGDGASGIYDDLASATFTGSWDVNIPTEGAIDYIGMVVTPGNRHKALRFSTADGVLELFGAIKSVSETQPDDPAGHSRTVNAEGIILSWRKSGS